ncbi:MAG: hypothetical protein I3270_01535 [Candidatus Moeniiplasma glomeromycotorum]|nr:hypothetical protein [Candidatus Moeniiplasma glomeromycotorum]MCE8162389.1 hypothetical protein [Candidatus Moeniiplasma glomeromycotorum]MCE8166314.1 hypothetical protein [Candidatus Moeniiplasma glomeromycotorum]MCE8166796.1 hypothetical protein [Candidatus Moeniiplasma glomeromycotorum]
MIDEFKLHNQKRKEYLNQKAKERHCKIKKIEQQEGEEIRKIINQRKECRTTCLLAKK